MSIKPEALAGQLARGVPAVTWIHGDEPLIVIESGDQVRASARKAGFDERIVMNADRYFQPDAIAAEVNALSLFASRKLIDIRFAGKPTRDVARLIGELAGRGIPEDIRLLVSSTRPDAALLKLSEFKVIEQAGLVVQVFPIDHGQLPVWIEQRLGGQKQRADRELLRLIASKVEGNLMAAAQEIRKLALLFDEGELPTEQATAAILEVARYEASDLVDAILAADVARAQRSLDGLVGEGRAETLVVWHLAECARSLLRIHEAHDDGTPMRQVMGKIRAFGPRQRLYEQAARRVDRATARQALTEAAQADTMAKGFSKGETWPLIRRIALRLAGVAQPADLH